MTDVEKPEAALIIMKAAAEYKTLLTAKEIETVIAALEASQPMLSGGDGMVMVPREPTEAMMEEGRMQIDTAYGDTTYASPEEAGRIYRAMIAAAPAPASNGEAVGRNAVLEEAAEIARAEQLRQLSKRGNNELDEAWETHNYGAVVSANIYDAIRALASAPAPQGMDVVERVARAICIARGFDPDDASGGELMWTAYDQAARAALSAINEKEDK